MYIVQFKSNCSCTNCKAFKLLHRLLYNVQLVCKLYILHHTSILLNVLQDVMDNVKTQT